MSIARGDKAQKSGENIEWNGGTDVRCWVCWNTKGKVIPVDDSQVLT